MTSSIQKSSGSKPFRGHCRVARLPDSEHLRSASTSYASPLDDTLLDAPWPDDLDPADVPFLTRTVTVLRRMGFFDDPSLVGTATEARTSLRHIGCVVLVPTRRFGGDG